MIRRGTWILLGLFAIALIATLWIGRGEEAPLAAADQPDPLWTLAADEIERVRVEAFGESQIVEVRRDPDTLWWMEEPESKPVEVARVERAVSWLLNPQPRSEIEMAADLSPYGLQDPAYQVTVFLDNGIQKTFAVGRVSPTGGSRYVFLPGRSSILLMTDFGLAEVLDLFTDLQPTPTPEVSPSPEVSPTPMS